MVGYGGKRPFLVHIGLCESLASWVDFRAPVAQKFQPSMMQNPYDLLMGV
jgi:hypothetical protein